MPDRSVSLAAALAATLAIVLSVAGCAQPPRPSQAWRPGDFALAMTVYEIPDPDGGPPRVVGQRYLVEPDAVLRAGFGPAAGDHGLPPVVRRLSREQLDELYATARAAGVLDLPRVDPDSDLRSARPTSPATHRFDPDDPEALIYVAQLGRRRYALARTGAGWAETDPAEALPDAEPLRSLLAELAFTPELATPR